MGNHETDNNNKVFKFNGQIILTMKVDFIIVRWDSSCMKRVGAVQRDTLFTPHLLIIHVSELKVIWSHDFTGQRQQGSSLSLCSKPDPNLNISFKSLYKSLEDNMLY